MGVEPASDLGTFQTRSVVQLLQQQLSDAVSVKPRDPSGFQDQVNHQGLTFSRSPPAYHVDTDKGFIYSTTDEAFVCQKKNHFQVTVHIGVATEPRYVRTPRGPQEVDHFLIKVFGIKVTSTLFLLTVDDCPSGPEGLCLHRWNLQVAR